MHQKVCLLGKCTQCSHPLSIRPCSYAQCHCADRPQDGLPRFHHSECSLLSGIQSRIISVTVMLSFRVLISLLNVLRIYQSKMYCIHLKKLTINLLSTLSKLLVYEHQTVQTGKTNNEKILLTTLRSLLVRSFTITPRVFSSLNMLVRSSQV